jgi:Ca-activated chloride channel family protein
MIRASARVAAIHPLKHSVLSVPQKDSATALVDDLKYSAGAPKPSELESFSKDQGSSTAAEVMTVKVRYKQPDGDSSALLEVPVTDAGKTLKEQDAVQTHRGCAKKSRGASLNKAPLFAGSDSSHQGKN